MNEAERLAYLDAMGITRYVPRRVLPGAKPSPVYDVVVEAVSREVPRTAAPAPALKALQESLQPPSPAPRAPQKAAPQPRASSPATTSNTKIHVRFHWKIYQPVPHLLALVPVAQTDAAALSLLQKILAAINSAAAPLLARDEFAWPLRSAASATSASLDDARETLHAFIEGCQLKQRASAPLRHLLVFDGHLAKTVFEGLSWPDIQVLVLPGLHTMLNSTPEKIAEAKRYTWQVLKELNT